MPFRYKVLAIITPAVFLLDLLTKVVIRTYLRIGDYIVVIPGYFDIVHVTNEGAAFGMFADSASTFRVPFFYIVSIIAVIIIVATLVRLPEQERMLAVIFSLILGGIAGNILDRLRFGKVTDFLSFHIRDKVADFYLLGHQFNFKLEWPSFNVADSAITVAMILLIWSLLKPAKAG